MNIRLGSRLSDVFGKAGTEVLQGLMEGKTIDEILDNTENRWLLKRRDEVEEVVKGVLSQSDIFVLRQCVDMVKQLDAKIRRIDGRVDALVDEREMEIVSSVPGVGRKSAAVITAEIGDARRFPDGKTIASAAGLAPSVYQSAGKNLTGRITKQGSKWLRRIMVQVAHSASKAKGTKLRRFYLSVKARKGAKTAVVALARKMLTIIHHLLVNGEEYVEDGYEKKRRRPGKVVPLVGVSLEDMVAVLSDAGFVIRPPAG